MGRTDGPIPSGEVFAAIRAIGERYEQWAKLADASTKRMVHGQEVRAVPNHEGVVLENRVQTHSNDGGSK